MGDTYFFHAFYGAAVGPDGAVVLGCDDIDEWCVYGVRALVHFLSAGDGLEL